MSKPRLKLSAVIDTEAHADTIIGFIRNKLVGKDIFEEHNLARSVNESGQQELNFDFRFNNRVDRDDVKDWMKNQVQSHPQVKNWVQSARMSDHLCSHDDVNIKDCKLTEYMEWIR